MTGDDGIRTVLAANGSPRAQKGMTDIIVRRFLAGAESAGAETEVLYPAMLKIRPCTGCLRCWFENPGVCGQKDDMPSVAARTARADLGVFASPVYVDGMTAQMKAMFDRFVAYTPPFFEYAGDRSYHPAPPRKGKVVVISACGFPERKHFDPIALHFRRICENMRAELLGEFYFPAASLIASDPDKVEPNLEAVFAAGREVVETGAISDATLREANADYVKDPRAVGEHINEVFRAVRKHHGVE